MEFLLLVGGAWLFLIIIVVGPALVIRYFVEKWKMRFASRIFWDEYNRKGK